MTPERYQDYLKDFNSRDYDGLCRFFTPDVVLYTEGHTIRGMDGIREFYAFFHSYVAEHIALKKMVSDDNFLFAEAVMSLTGIRHLSREVLTEKGFSRFVEVPKGLQVEVDLWLHYDIEDNQFKQIRCATYVSPDIA